MRFNGIITDLIPTPTGIPQGSPLDPISQYRYKTECSFASCRTKRSVIGETDTTGPQALLELGQQIFAVSISRYLLRPYSVSSQYTPVQFLPPLTFSTKACRPWTVCGKNFVSLFL